MEQLLFSQDTRLSLTQLLSSPPHALMIIGDKGAGKKELARHFCAALLGTTPDKLLDNAYYRLFEPINSSIGIDQIRDLQKLLKLKTTGKSAIRRVIVIVDAHLMTTEAQNALLKVLEEPPADTSIILTLAGERSLKSTIYSRSQRVVIKPPSMSQATEYFITKGHEEAAIKRNYMLAGGQAGLMTLLLNNSNEHTLVHALKAAKDICVQSLFGRLSQVDKLAKQKETIPELLFALRKVLSASLHNAAQSGNSQKIRQLNNGLQAVYEAEASIKNSPNTKLLLTNLFLRI